MLNLIDLVGLTDSDALPAHIYVKALRLAGYLIPPQERDHVLESLRLAPSTGVNESGHQATVWTGPGGADYWLAAPTSVRVCIVPGDSVISQKERADSLLEWFLRRRGLTQAQARALVAKPPTAKHGQFQHYLAALDDEERWNTQGWMDGIDRPIDWSTFEYVGGEAPAQSNDYEVVIVDDWLKYAALAAELDLARAEDHVIGFDVETDEEDNYEARYVGASFAFGAHEKGRRRAGNGSTGEPGPVAYYLPANGPLGPEPVFGLLRLHFIERLPPWYTAHGSKFDMQVLAKATKPADPVSALRWISQRLRGDGVMANYCEARVEANGRPEAKGLKWCAKRDFDADMLTFDEMLGLSGATKASEAPLKDIGPYCCADAWWGVREEELARIRLADTPKLLDLYEKLELPTVAVLAEMELLGLPVNDRLLKDRLKDYTAKVEVLRRYLEETAIEAGWQPPLDGTIIQGYNEKTVACDLHARRKAEYEVCDVCDAKGRVIRTLPLNPGSGPQIVSVIQGTFKLPAFATTDAGAPSNDESALLKLREYTQDPNAKDWITFFLAWRKHNKVRGTVLEGIGKRMRTDDWEPVHKGGSRVYVHPRYNQDIVVTGRLSSSDPNGQQVDREQRDLFPIGWNADYSQLELRIFAFASKCSAMIQTFMEGGDIHAATTWRIFGVHPKDQTPSLRVRGKTLNFGISYGAQGETVQEQIIKTALQRPELQIAIPSLVECKEMVKTFWRAYPEAREWVEFIKEVVRDRMWSETLYGRREYFPLIRSNIPELRARAERQSVNLVIQGTAGDIIKMAAYMLWQDAPKYGADIRAQVHDELLGCVWPVEGKPDIAEQWVRLVEQQMVLDQPLSPVPLKVEPKLVGTWKDK